VAKILSELLIRWVEFDAVYFGFAGLGIANPGGRAV
jgi:hypothetical protein